MLAKLCGASWNPPTLHDPFDTTLAPPCVARGLRPEDVQNERNVLASSFFGHPAGSKFVHHFDSVAPDFSSTRSCHPARRSQALSFFEDAYQASSNQRVRNDESLQRAEGQNNVKLEDIRIQKTQRCLPPRRMRRIPLTLTRHRRKNC